MMTLMRSYSGSAGEKFKALMVPCIHVHNTVLLTSQHIHAMVCVAYVEMHACEEGAS